MNRLTNHLVYAVLILGIFTQCDNVQTETPKIDELIPIELVAPQNNSTVKTLETQLVWQQIKGAKTYRVMLSKSDTFEKTEIDTTVVGNSMIISSLSPQTTYSWKVFPIKKTQSGPWSEVWNFTTGGSAETSTVMLVSPADSVDKVSTDLEFIWNQLTGTSEYTYQLSDNSSFSSVIAEETVPDTLYTPDSLLHQKKYYWRVKDAEDIIGDTWSDTRTFTTETEDTEPETTTSVTLIAPVDGADKVSTNLEFTWNALSGTSEYTYQLSDDEAFGYTITDEIISGTSYTPEDLLERKKYYWRVKAAGDAEGETWSDTRSFTTGANDTEPVTTTSVTLISPVDGADKVSTNLEFTWNPLSGTSEYTYQLSDDDAFGYTITEETISGTSHTPENLLERKKYYWRVKAAGDATGDTWSDTRSFTTGATGDTGTNPGTPASVELLSPADNASDLSVNPDFEWSEVTGVSDYEFQLAEDNSFSFIVEESVETGTTYQASNLTYQTQYYWRVKASGDAQEWSAPRSFTTMAEPATPTPPPSSSSFVQVHNSDFVVDGQAMHFAGTNAYYLPNYEKLNPAVVDRALNLFQDTGITVIRMWGFYDGYDCGYSQHDANENVIQTAPGEYSEEALRDLDKVIAKGKERGIGFIIPFINFWDQLGGVCQYNTWAGASNPSTNMEFFLNNNDTQKWYKDYVKMLLNRVNTVTGVAYKDEPAIVAWQIMNEGRNPGADATILRDWYQEMAQYIKSIDPNHLVSTGEEGFDEGTPSVYSVGEYSNTYTLRAQVGSSYVMNTAIPEIDFGNAHWYPSEYGFGIDIDEDLLRAQRAWLDDHKKIAESSGKPFIVGEFGFPGWGDERVSSMYTALYEHAESIQLDGNLFWQLTADGTKCWEFGGNICYPDGRVDTDLYLDFKDHVTALKDLK